MKKEKRYCYIGINGTLDTTICLEDVPCVAYTKLIASNGHILTDGNTQKYDVNIYDGDDMDVWKEIPIGQD